MRYFACDCDDNVALFFENTECLSCHRPVGWCYEFQSVLVFDVTDKGEFLNKERRYIPCANRKESVCNGMIPAELVTDPDELCFACHFNDNIPNLSVEGHRELWGKLEAAKRRLLFTLTQLKLPLPDKKESPKGLTFHFLADGDASDHFHTPLTHVSAVFTGHAQGDITINLAEADDVARHRMRVNMGEQYRTLLGHFRHEVGHFYWDLLIKPSEQLLVEFAKHFGDPNLSYKEALKTHYERDQNDLSWQPSFISAYASMHPWEDWAETFAHYLHIVDTLETAREWQVVSFVEYDGLVLPQDGTGGSDPEVLFKCWIRLSVKLNALNRSMGVPDAYPFVMTSRVIEKLKFVHNVVRGSINK